MDKISENNSKMEYLADTYGDAYFTLFGDLVLAGMSIQGAIDYCVEHLNIPTGKLGSHK